MIIIVVLTVHRICLLVKGSQENGDFMYASKCL